MGILSTYVKWLGKEAEGGIEKAVSGFLPKNHQASYLDCGCDDGSKTLRRAEVIGTKSVYAIEVVSGRAELARQKGIKVSCFDLNRGWKMSPLSFDVITATEVIEHLIDLDNFFTEVKGVLKKGGQLIISTENLASPHNMFTLLLGNQPFTGPYLSRKFSVNYQPVDYYRNSHDKNLMPPHLNVMTKKALVKLLRLNGFADIKVRGVGYYPFPPPISNIMAFFARNYATYVVVSAVKE